MDNSDGTEFGELKVNDVVVQGGNMISTNGIVHKIYDVLMPPDLILKAIGVDIFFDQISMTQPLEPI